MLLIEVKFVTVHTAQVYFTYAKSIWIFVPFAYLKNALLGYFFISQIYYDRSVKVTCIGSTHHLLHCYIVTLYLCR